MWVPDECPLCITPWSATDLQFRPCPCGYRICVWCWHTMNTLATDGLAPRCPNCRADYDVQAVLAQRVAAPPRALRKAAPGKEKIADLCFLDRCVVAVRGLPVWKPTSSAAGAVESATESRETLPSDLRQQQYFTAISFDDFVGPLWMGQFGRMSGAMLSRRDGMGVVRYRKADDAASAVAAFDGCEFRWPSAAIRAAGVPVVVPAGPLGACRRSRPQGRGARLNREEDGEAASPVGQATTGIVMPVACSPLNTPCRRPPTGAAWLRFVLTAALVPSRYCSAFLKDCACEKKYCVDRHEMLPADGAIGSASAALPRHITAANLPTFGVLPNEHGHRRPPPRREHVVTPADADPAQAAARCREAEDDCLLLLPCGPPLAGYASLPALSFD